MIKCDDGMIWIEKGERFPFKCPECGNYIEWHPMPTVKCEACGCMGTPVEFSNVHYVIEEPTVN